MWSFSVRGSSASSEDFRPQQNMAATHAQRKENTDMMAMATRAMTKKTGTKISKSKKIKGQVQVIIFNVRKNELFTTRSLICGKGSSGTGCPTKLQIGSQPSLTLYSRSLSEGTVFRTNSTQRSYPSARISIFSSLVFLLNSSGGISQFCHIFSIFQK